MNISFTGENLIQDVCLHWMNVSFTSGLHLGCLSTVDECLFHTRGLCLGTLLCAHLQPNSMTRWSEFWTFQCLLQNQEEGDSTISKIEIVANMNVKILALNRKFEHPSIQTPEVCFLLQPDNYKDQAQAFVSLSTPKAWTWCSSSPAAISRKCILELGPVRDSVFVAYWLICWRKHTPSHTFYCAHSITKQFVFLLVLLVLLPLLLGNLLQCICP